MNTKILEYFKKGLDKYKYVLIVCLAGLFLAAFPYGGSAPQEAPESRDAMPDLKETEGKLEDILSQINGVGRVKVVLTAKSGAQQIFAYNEQESTSQSNGSSSYDRQGTLVSVGSGSGGAPVTVKTLAPEYRGALVVCDGGDASGIKLEVTRAVSSLTGLTSDNIVVSKMK